LSKEWFSIISTTMCSIFGIEGCPAGRWEKGRAVGPAQRRQVGTGRAQAGRPAPATIAAPPAAPRSSVRRVTTPLSTPDIPGGIALTSLPAMTSDDLITRGPTR